MKLKKLLILAFATLTIVPALIISLLLYKSGVELSKESHTRNLNESIHVQADFLSQTIENNMIFDSRFLQKNYKTDGNTFDEAQKNELLSAFEYYLETSEDRISVCMLLDQDGMPLYTIGESKELNVIRAQLPDMSTLDYQTIIEFDLENESRSLGIVTPALDKSGANKGCLISIYDEMYLFKIISSYYEITGTSTYIYTETGNFINLGGYAVESDKIAVEQDLLGSDPGDDGIIDTRAGDTMVLGYYKNINNTPWYLAGLIDQAQIYAFTNQFIWVYILIILAVIIISVILSLSFSRKVVEPINHLIQVMDGYPDSLKNIDAKKDQKRGYYETQYLQAKFLDLMKTIMLVQHNFEGVYQLYQSNDMDDTNIDIDVINQTISTNKAAFSDIINGLVVPTDACIVEKFTRCFCDDDQILLMKMFEKMRDEHLAIMQEAEVFTTKFGQKWFHILTVPMYDGNRLSRLFVQLRDISNYKRQEYESIRQSKHDPLTGLLNRSGFTSLAEKILAEHIADAQHGLLFIDMNNFKLVNDNLGHSAGDDLLRNVAQALKKSVKPEGFVTRFGGDEFAVFLPHTSFDAVENMKEILTQKLVYPYKHKNKSFTISASIGGSIWSEANSVTLDELLNQADKDMYIVKKKMKQNI